MASRISERNLPLGNRLRKPEFSWSSRHPLLQVQACIGNQAVGRLLHARLKVGEPVDQYERKADQIAEQIVQGCDATQVSPNHNERNPVGGQRLAAGNSETSLISPNVESQINNKRGTGEPLPENIRASFESGFGYDFSGVRVHTDAESAETARAVNAQAFTVEEDIVFGSGAYAPEATEGQKLLAHELTHVVQQQGGEGPTGTIQRVLVVRPPGKGEFSAFDRRQHLINRLNTISTAIQYELRGRQIVYKVMSEGSLTVFDRKMRGFIDGSDVVPMRLITSSGYVRSGTGGGYEPLTIDEWVSAYVDLDDLLASDDVSFQTNLVHFLTERFATPNYEKRIGAPKTLTEFYKVHSVAHDAEADVLRDLIGDPALCFLGSGPAPDGSWEVEFGNILEGYSVMKEFSNPGKEVEPSRTYVQTYDGRQMSVEQYRKERMKGDFTAPSTSVRYA